MVSAWAELAADVEVGPYAIVDGPVRLGPGAAVLAHTHVQGDTTVGANGRLGPAAYVGLPPQHLAADPDVGSLVLGDGVTVRETAPVHRSTAPSHPTRVGDRCLVMGGAHVPHDCQPADDVILSQGVVLLGGHVRGRSSTSSSTSAGWPSPAGTTP